MFVFRPDGTRGRTEGRIRETAQRNSDVLRPKVERPIDSAPAIRTKIICKGSLGALDRAPV
jgi:hypothetical protein